MLVCNNPALARRFTNQRMDTAMCNARRNNTTQVPNTLIQLGILLDQPDMRTVCRTVDGQDYIFQGISGRIQDNSVSLVFASERMITFLQSCDYLHINVSVVGKLRKPYCCQIFNVLTKYGSAVIPIVRVLMRERTEAAYMALFNHLRALAPNLQPTRLHCDFEGAQVNAIRQSFPGCVVEGSLWNYGVQCSSEAFKLGLSPLAARNDLVLSFIKCLCAAPLLPAGLIEPGVEEIWREVQASGWADDLEPLFVYFRRDWLPHVAELSVYDCPRRTSYCCYSDNRMLAYVSPQNDQNIWCLLRGFVQAEHLSWSDKLAIDRREVVSDSRKWKEIAKERRVCRLIRRLDKNEISPGRVLKETSHFVAAAVHYGLQLNNRVSYSQSSNDSD
ncbi:Methionine aminopeptidase 2 [Frankliniella fusca]|uniref:Methionine aminopeptidase 2 n=1 Tax=Frankliniella fusca TaxID=407009 RepID=A0AAE1GXC4_9NEOP|nr:Methionine aminopeptidase 2 [Frankliniella fusca]